MSSLLNKMKDKLHIGKDHDQVGSATYNNGASKTATSGVADSAAGRKTAGAKSTPAQAGHDMEYEGAAAAKQAAATEGRTTGPGVAVQGQQSAPQEAVTIKESDPNWVKARELTHGAEEASKISAAKAYEAEAHLVAAQDAHRAAQEATNRQAELAAQAEAEKKNIGGADYIHRELDSAKHKAEEREKVHIEFNKNLETTRQLVAAKEGELGSVMPVAMDHQKGIDNLSNQLGSIQGAKADLENKHGAHVGHLNKLKDQHSQYANEVARLESEVEALTLDAKNLEDQARAARIRADEKARELAAARDAANSIAKEANKTAQGLQNVQRDLQGYQNKEVEVGQKLAASQAAAKDAFDLAAAKEAELQLARQQLDAEHQKGLPVEQDIERYRKQVQEREREYVEAQESSKAAKIAYEKFAAEADKAAKEAIAATHAKETKLETYKQLKAEAQDASAREAELWNEAKKYGNTGDANALQRLAEAEKTLGMTEGNLNAPIVAPNVGPKQPTTEGPKIHRSERATENNEDIAKEDVHTKH